MDKFDFKQRLGSGSFGEVWLAIDIGLQAECAVKCIPPEKVINQGNFFHEAQILKIAEHKNIVRVLATGTLPDGRVYVSMEYLKKGSLDDEAKGSYVHLTRARKLMIDVLRGLEYTHSKEIIHRDIKPSNILIGDSLEGKLSDFGLALHNINSLDLKMIKDYKYRMHLAPEVRTPKDFSKLSDIYACGVTLYRLVNGDSYFSPPAFPLLKGAIEKGEFPNRDRYREFIPRSLKLLINKAMHINAARRFQSAEEMRRAIERIEIHMNWNEQLLPKSIRWVAGWDKKCYEVERAQETRNTWKVTTKKGKSKHCLRGLNKTCFKNISEEEAVRRTKNILQNFVNGTIK